MLKTIKTCLLITAAFFMAANFKHAPQSTATFSITIRPVFGDQELVLKHQAYLTESGDSVYIDALRFYITDVRLLPGKEQAAVSSGYHLLDAKDPQSLGLQVQAPAATALTGMSFEIGVDSLSNVSGAMGGDLDPAKGMYWAWNSGYVNAKLEGRSSACHTLHHAFEFHIGGYAAPYHTRRKVTLLFKTPPAPGDNIVINANVAAWLNQVHLKELNSIVMPSKEAVLMADNYAGMFSIAE